MAEPGRHAALTPEGVRDGTPAALGIIVDRRGPAVLAFCAAVCAPDDARAATAEAFARFRGAVAASGDPRGLDPDALLISATRHAAAARAVRPVPTPPSRLGRLLGSRPEPTDCAEVPALLVARVEGSADADEATRLEDHLRRDGGCRAVEQAFARAEAAFEAPPAAPLPVDVLTDALALMVAVAPILETGDELDVHEAVPVDEPRAPEAPAEEEDPAAPAAVAVAPAAPQRPSSSSSTPVGAPRPAASTPVGVADDEEPARPLVADAQPGPRSSRRRHGPLFDVVLPVGLIGAGAAGVLAVAGVFSPSHTDRPREAAAPVLPAPGVDPATGATSTLDAAALDREAVVARLERDRRRRARRTLQAAERAEQAAATQPAGAPTP